MVEIKPTESTRGFASPVQFERTGRVRDRVIDCSREELIDLVFCQIEMLERFQLFTEKTNQELEEFLGWRDPM